MFKVIDDFIIEKGLVTAAFKEQKVEPMMTNPPTYSYTYTNYQIKLILRGMNNITHYLSYSEEEKRDDIYKRIVEFMEAE